MSVSHADGSKEMERLREAVLSGRGQLKQAEQEADRWAGQCSRLQSQVREQAQAVLHLKQEKQNSLDNSTRYSVRLQYRVASSRNFSRSFEIWLLTKMWQTALNNISVYTSVNRLQHEVNVLQQQLSECQCLVHTLQCELQVYQRVCGTTESSTGKKRVHLSETQSKRSDIAHFALQLNLYFKMTEICVRWNNYS